MKFSSDFSEDCNLRQNDYSCLVEQRGINWDWCLTLSRFLKTQGEDGYFHYSDVVLSRVKLSVYYRYSERLCQTVLHCFADPPVFPGRQQNQRHSWQWCLSLCLGTLARCQDSGCSPQAGCDHLLYPQRCHLNFQMSRQHSEHYSEHGVVRDFPNLCHCW